MKLELKHLAPYLPYGLDLMCEYKSSFENKPNTIRIEKWNPTDIFAPLTKRYGVVSKKPILRPLTELKSDILKQIRQTTLSQYFWECYDMDGGIKAAVLSCPYQDVIVLIEHHFDVFGLIDAGVAVNLNKITP